MRLRPHSQGITVCWSPPTSNISNACLSSGFLSCHERRRPSQTLTRQKKRPSLLAKGAHRISQSSGGLTQLAGCGQLRVPLAGLLDGAFQSTKIHEDESEALGIAFRPLVVVHKAPGVVAADGDAFLVGASDRANVSAEESDAPLVRHLTFFVGHVVVG